MPNRLALIRKNLYREYPIRTDVIYTI